MNNTPSSRRIVIKDKLEFLINFSHNDNEIKTFLQEKQKLTDLIKSTGLKAKIVLPTSQIPLPRTECHILVGKVGSTREEKTILFTGTATKHKNDHNNRCIARSTAFDHAIESDRFLELLKDHGIRLREFKIQALNTLKLRYVKCEVGPSPYLNKISDLILHGDMSKIDYLNSCERLLAQLQEDKPSR